MKIRFVEIQYFGSGFTTGGKPVLKKTSLLNHEPTENGARRLKIKKEDKSPARADDRALDALRPVKITPDYLDFSAGSALIEIGKTKVIAAATVEEKVPHFMKGSGRGWITAEYALLPCSTEKRSPRERSAGRLSGRTQDA